MSDEKFQKVVESEGLVRLYVDPALRCGLRVADLLHEALEITSLKWWSTQNIVTRSCFSRSSPANTLDVLMVLLFLCSSVGSWGLAASRSVTSPI